MATPDLQQLDVFVATLPERARSFAECGVAVPFTTPMLAAARLRRLPGKAPELVLPPLGGRGSYVLGWDSCLGLSPTLHDRALWPRLASLPVLTPATIRAAAREVAAQGLAGRAAQAAALAARQAQATLRAGLEARFAAATSPAEALAEALAETGPDGGPSTPVAARLDALSAFAEAATAQALAASEPTDRETARLVASAAQLALAAARASLAALRQAVEPLQATPSDPAAVARVVLLAARPDWLLDGWWRPAALARLAPGSLAALLREVLLALPVAPFEAEEWWSSAGGWDAILRGRARLAPRALRGGEARVEMVARLEAMRAVAA
ncbi:hypothetical protein [Falsiroseomonas sp.]|uniref:hypothetical protein n=1 Tax=Falsiroseomonas sp. TaxID=2870721 RepID=UPI003566F21B